MAHLINLETHTDERGNLTVIEKLPFDIKRVFYIYGVDDSERGGHSHKKTIQLVVCLQGSCKIKYPSNAAVVLNSPTQGLLLQPEEWHKMYDFTPDAILMVLCSEEFDKEDYVH
ncbi:MAG: WxcM-like domain-containing protein [Alphaproteobacteria bacterium]|nr:WxcM-like domain-containing protein [Alphaproteobacteria bacterium]